MPTHSCFNANKKYYNEQRSGLRDQYFVPCPYHRLTLRSSYSIHMYVLRKHSQTGIPRSVPPVTDSARLYSSGRPEQEYKDEVSQTREATQASILDWARLASKRAGMTHSNPDCLVNTLVKVFSLMLCSIKEIEKGGSRLGTSGVPWLEQ